ncbi:MAG: hypothetical protein EBV06_06710 [Planctomycetia bacterium]|nr:hypothetical protein [Planctomycetia bacterium]
MKSLPSLIDKNGQPIPLDRELASGGEGVVLTILNNNKLVAKLYHRQPSDQTAEKLATMVSLANPELLKLAAWPIGLLYHAQSRQVAGFLMPRLNEFQPIQQLYNPIQRLRCFPRAGWNFQVRAAINLASAFEEIHKIGCLIGDVNQSNIQVSIHAVIRFIDCDSFQVQVNGKAFLCEVGVAHYLPPELQNKSLHGLLRNENHDRFGLAVLIYQLLFAGRHPYAGVYHGAGDPSFEQLIADFRFAQGPLAHTWKMSPPPHTPTFVDIPPDLGNLFRRAFERGSEKNTRPSPTEWLMSLKRLEQSLVVCAIDTGHTYWRGAHSCVWCRLGAHGGPEYYFGVAGDVATFAVDEVKLHEVLRRLRECGLFDFRLARHRFVPPQSPKATPLPQGAQESQSAIFILTVVICLCLFAVPFGIIHWAICLGGVLCASVFGIWLAIAFWTAPYYWEIRRRRVALKDATIAFEKIEATWKSIVSRYQRAHYDTSKSVQTLITQCYELASQYQIELKELTIKAEEMGRLRHLRLHLIADADIPQIGTRRKQILASSRMFTAADINDQNVRNIKGFADVLTSQLLYWKNQVQQQFHFDPATAVSVTDKRSLTAKFRNQHQQLLASVNHEITKLESLAPECQASLNKLTPDLQRVVARCEQAEADMKIICNNNYFYYLSGKY